MRVAGSAATPPCTLWTGGEAAHDSRYGSRSLFKTTRDGVNSVIALGHDHRVVHVSKLYFSRSQDPDRDFLKTNLLTNCGTVTLPTLTPPVVEVVFVLAFINQAHSM